MGDKKEIVKQFKELTGFSTADIARNFNFSPQFIHQVKNNRTITYKASMAFYMTVMVDDKIKQLEENIEKLQRFKGVISESVKR